MEEPKYQIPNSDSGIADKKANMDKFIGSKLLSMVETKKQEILSQQTVDALNAQPMLKGIDMILKAGIKNEETGGTFKIRKLTVAYHRTKKIRDHLKPTTLKLPPNVSVIKYLNTPTD